MHIHFNNFFEIVSLALLSGVVAIPLLRLNIRFASRLGLIDWPKSRGLAQDQIPIVGPSLVLLAAAGLAFLTSVFNVSPWFLTTSVVIGVMGYVDDRKPLGAADKIFFQLVCVSVMVFLDPRLHETLTVQYGSAGTFWGAFFILGLMNAVNFIDGIDGLAAVVITSGAIGFLCLASRVTESSAYTTLAAMIAGMMCPFFYFNVKRRRGFLGNVGSYYFSYVLAVMHLSLPLPGGGAIERLSLSGLCFLIPIADAMMVVTTRLLTLRSPFQADKGHLHHRLIQTSLSLKFILLSFGVIELASVGVAYAMAGNPGISNSPLPIFVTLSHVAITAMLVLLVERASRRRVQAYFQRLDVGCPVYFLRYEFTRLDGKPLTPRALRRLEARVSAEIRVTDLCIAELPNVLRVTLKTPSEPVRGISNRLDTVFQSERVVARLEVEKGEFVRVAEKLTPNRKTA